MNQTQEAPLYPPMPEIRHLTFRSSRIIYYGPHACSNCGISICKMGHEFGGTAFTYPSGPIYPNSEWHPHVCDPKRVASLPKASEPPQHPPDVVRMYSDSEVRKILRRAQKRGINLEAGSPIEKLTIADLDDLLT